MKSQHYHYIVLSLIVSVIAMMMSERVALAVPTAWLEMPSGTTTSLNGIWGTSATDIFIVGSGGTILRYDGDSWNPMTADTNKWLSGVWGSDSSDVFAVGANGTIFHYDGNDDNLWMSMDSGTTETLFSP